MIHRVLRIFIVLGALACAGISRLDAQDAAAVPGTEATPAYKVGVVTIKFVGTANVNQGPADPSRPGRASH